MAEQLHDQIRQRRAKPRPDALEQQFALSKTAKKAAQPPAQLRELGRLVATLDQLACNAVISLLENVDFDGADFSETTDKAGTLGTFKRLNDVLLNDIISDFSQPEFYLISDSATSMWTTTERLCRLALIRSRGQPNLRTNVVSIVNDLIEDLTNASKSHLEVLGEAVDSGVFKPEMKPIARNRWTLMSRIFINFAKETERKDMLILNWAPVANVIQRGSKRPGPTGPNSLNRISISLWLTLSIFLITVPTAALGLRCSPHSLGTTRDADFWFLMQSSAMAILNFAVIAIPIWRNTIYPKNTMGWVWALIASASLCSVLAPATYTLAPTEWSSFMGIITGIIQSVLTLQIALVADEGTGGQGRDAKQD